MFEVSQVSVFIRFRMILGDGGVWLVKEGQDRQRASFLVPFALKIIYPGKF